MKFRSLFLIFCLAVLAWTGPVFAQSVTLTPPASDAFVAATNGSSNYGGAGAVAISGSSSSKGEFDSLLRFNFTTVKSAFDGLYGAGGWLLQSVTLTLTAQEPTNLLFNSQAAGQLGFKWLQNDSWIEGTGRPNNPTTDGIAFNGLAALQDAADESLGTFAFDGGTSGTRTFSLGLTPGFRTDATAGNLVSFLIRPASTGVSALFSANGVMIDPSEKPMLTVTAAPVPEPCGSILMLAGALTLAGRRVRGRKEV